MTDYKLMPVEPTQEMLDRVMGVVTGFSGAYGEFNDYLDEETAREVYAAFSADVPPVCGETRDGTYHPLKNIDTWRKGCPCAVYEPGECRECTDELIDAIERWFLAGGAVTAGTDEVEQQGTVEHYDQAPDWGKAPEGATHWAAETDDTYAVWYRVKDGGWECWVHPDGCSWCRVSTDYLPNLIPRPETAWIPTNGEKPDLPDNMRVDVMYRDGDTDTGLVQEWRWAWIGTPGDVTHYRIQGIGYGQQDNR